MRAGEKRTVAVRRATTGLVVVTAVATTAATATTATTAPNGRGGTAHVPESEVLSRGTVWEQQRYKGRGEKRMTYWPGVGEWGRWVTE